MPGPSDDIGGEPRPADRAVPGTAGAKQALCPECQGAGELMDKPCLACNGTGTIAVPADDPGT